MVKHNNGKIVAFISVTSWQRWLFFFVDYFLVSHPFSTFPQEVGQKSQDLARPARSEEDPQREKKGKGCSAFP